MLSVIETLQLARAQAEIRRGLASKRDVEELLCFVLQINWSDLFLALESDVSKEEYAKFEKLLLQYCEGCPLAYLLKEVDFYHLKLAVNQDVLIPRVETEILVDKACNIISKDCCSNRVLFDIGTGSGCIGLSIKKQFPTLKTYLSDMSSLALDIARKNAKNNNIEAIFLEGDLLDPYHGLKADYVFSNPPYIKYDDYLGLEDSVKNFEPKKALISGETGLECYINLEKKLPYYLNNKAKIFFEMGHDQGMALLTIFDKQYWSKKSSEKDFSGKDRFFFLEFDAKYFVE